MNPESERKAPARVMSVLAALAIALQLALPDFISAQEEEKIGGWGGAALRVQMNEESDRLLNGRIGPGLIQTLARRRFVPWERSAVCINVVRTRIALGAVTKNWNTDSLAALLTLSEKSSYARTNPYVRLTKDGGNESYEAQLAARIRNSPGNLAPQDVLAISLDVCRDDYSLATLTAHNLLKEVAYAERRNDHGVIGVAPGRKGDLYTTILPRDISSKLIDLRPEGDAVFYDRMGPWYHAFGLFFVGSVASGTEAQIFSEIENLTRLLHAGSAPDYFKERINTWAGNLAPKLNAQVNRNISSSPPPAPPPSLPPAPSAGNGYWKFTGERVVKGKPFLVGPADTSKVDTSGGGSTLTTNYSQRNWRSTATFSWTPTGGLGVLQPGAKLSFRGILTHSGDGSASAGISFQAYGQEPGTGGPQGSAATKNWDRVANRTETKQAEITVPSGALFPGRRMELRFEVYPGGASSALYRTYEWASSNAPQDGGRTAPAAADWSGSWSSDFGRMSVRQDGSQVTGTYDFKGGRFDGNVVGNMLRGRWTQTNGSGRFEFQLSADGRSFSGRWGYGETLSGGAWKGRRE